jgi:hypothetical protein
MKPKIYDCITFFQSNLLFELRFHELKNIVDHFVVCEATKTHMGQPKKINFDYKKTAKDLHKEFEGKIKLFSVNASATEMWVDVIGKTLENVKIVKEGEYHKAGSVLLELEKEKRIISISPLDGLVIDYYEED